MPIPIIPISIIKGITQGNEKLDEWDEGQYEEYKRNERLNSREYEGINDLNSMKKYVYNDSFKSFCQFYKELKNANLGELEFKEFEFSNTIIDNDNTKKIADLLFEAHYILIDTMGTMRVSNGLSLSKTLSEKLKHFQKTNENLPNNDEEDIDYGLYSCNYKDLSVEQQEIIEKVFFLAEFVQKVCINDDLSNDIFVEFTNIIFNFEEDLEFKKFRNFS